jgi:hypothetical protein
MNSKNRPKKLTFCNQPQGTPSSQIDRCAERLGRAKLGYPAVLLRFPRVRPSGIPQWSAKDP